MKAAVVALCFFVVFLAPVMVGIDIYFDGKDKVIYYTVRIFKVIKIVKGTIVFERKGIEITYFKRIKKITYKKLFSGNKNYKILLSLDLVRLNALLEIGSSENKVSPIMVGAIYNAITSPAISYLKQNNNLLNASNGVEIHQSCDLIKYNLSVIICFNFALLCFAIIKKIMEK